jgi:hypothetical protein
MVRIHILNPNHLSRALILMKLSMISLIWASCRSLISPGLTETTPNFGYLDVRIILTCLEWIDQSR